jgi:Gelsolin repeat
VFLLDTYTQVFLWIGEGSTEEEKGKGLIFANKFIKEVHTYIPTHL